MAEEQQELDRKLSSALNSMQRSLEKVQAKRISLEQQIAALPVTMTSDEFAKYIENEIVKWGRVVKEGNIKAQ